MNEITPRLDLELRHLSTLLPSNTSNSIPPPLTPTQLTLPPLPSHPPRKPFATTTKAPAILNSSSNSAGPLYTPHPSHPLTYKSPRKMSSDTPPPSSFDGDTDFYEESRLKKLGRRLKEEPLVPLGMLLTCAALFGATRAMRSNVRSHSLPFPSGSPFRC